MIKSNQLIGRRTHLYADRGSVIGTSCSPESYALIIPSCSLFSIIVEALSSISDTSFTYTLSSFVLTVSAAKLSSTLIVTGVFFSTVMFMVGAVLWFLFQPSLCFPVHRLAFLLLMTVSCWCNLL